MMFALSATVPDSFLALYGLVYSFILIFKLSSFSEFDSLELFNLTRENESTSMYQMTEG